MTEGNVNEHIAQQDMNPAMRSRARRRALQAVYAWQMSNLSIHDLLKQFEQEQDMKAADQPYFEDLVRGVIANSQAIDQKLTPHIDRAVTEIDPIERAVLRIATFEMMQRLDVPYRVIINEAIESAKRFGADFGHTYVNGVLDKVAHEIRAVEM